MMKSRGKKGLINMIWKKEQDTESQWPIFWDTDMCFRLKGGRIGVERNTYTKWSQN